MIASPATAARQISIARADRAVRAAQAASAPVRLAYVTTTGDAPRAWREDVAQRSAWEDLDYCFVCSRATDHVAEHDDMLEAGLVTYEEGSVLLTLDGQAWRALERVAL